MATNASGEFEKALARLDEIVTKLEKENVSLDESVALFKEGKALQLKCEALLKDAQTSIEAIAKGESSAAQAAAPRTSDSLFRTSAGADEAPF